MSNQLATAQSAYLRSAAHQPIHWQVWGPEAFMRARREDRPVLLDIGAVWCHWCHVMDGESYEDPELAAFLNESFVCIKVDRDERPDVDARYQRAVQAITSQGGWPLTAFLTPEGKVFYGGTYFPPDGKYGRPGFRAVLEQVRKVYHGEREKVERQADTLTRVLAEHFEEIAPGDPTPAVLEDALRRMASLFDYRNGGFGTQPKFPHPAAVTLLLGHWRDTREDWAREMAARTLTGMARGGIHDHLGGGFHRYSVDARWIVPHFEKMSYDNAGLLTAYLDGVTALGEEECAATARGIVRWVREVLADPAGGYAASQDADVGLHDDGDYFTWTREEAEAAIGDGDAFAVAAAYYDIGTAGEMQHDPSRNVLHTPEPLAAIAARLGLDPATALTRLMLARERMRAARAARPAPYVDTTRYTAWNGMLAGALVRAGVVLDDPWARDHALRTLGRIREEHDDPTRLRHSPGGMAGLLDDQAQVALALLDAHEATGDPQWLDWAVALLDRVWVDYLDPAEGGLFDAAGANAEGLLATRVKPIQDAPTPSPNGVAVLGAARLAELTGESRWAERRDGLLRAFAGSAAQLGLHGATYLRGLDWSVRPVTHLVIVEGGEADAERQADALHRAALGTFFPRRVVQRLRRGDAERPGLPPPVRALLAASRQTRAIACQDATCEQPATSLDEWRAILAQLAGAAR